MTKNTYDVLIVGSGASGGMAAHILTQKGAKCLVLEAGPLVDFNRQRGVKLRMNCRIADSVNRASCR